MGILVRIARYAAAIGVLGAAVLHPAHSFAQIEPNFSWTPANPLHTLPITLDGSASTPSSGLTFGWQVVEQGGPGGYNGCPAAVQCVIPADTLDPDTTYDVTLTASNDTDTSVKTKTMTVGNGNVAPVISCSPTDFTSSRWCFLASNGGT